MKRLIALLLFALPAFADVYPPAVDNPCTDLYFDAVPLYDVANPEKTLTGADPTDTNFIIRCKGDNQTLWTEFETTADIEAVGTIGTHCDPTANTDVCWGEISTTGTYQLHLHDDMCSVSSATKLTCWISDQGTTFVDQFIRVNQNPLQASDVTSSVASALAADLVLASGTCDSGSTTTCVDAARTESETDHWQDAALCATNGTAIGQCRRITGFTPGSDTITSEAFPVALSGSTDYEIRRGSYGFNAVDTDAVTVTAGGFPVGGFASGAITADAMATDSIGADELSSAAVDEFWNEVIETAGSTWTARCIQAVTLAMAAGTYTDSGSTRTFKDPSGSTDRIVGTLTSTTRSSMTVTCP